MNASFLRRRIAAPAPGAPGVCRTVPAATPGVPEDSGLHRPPDTRCSGVSDPEKTQSHSMSAAMRIPHRRPHRVQAACRIAKTASAPGAGGRRDPEIAAAPGAGENLQLPAVSASGVGDFLQAKKAVCTGCGRGRPATGRNVWTHSESAPFAADRAGFCRSKRYRFTTSPRRRSSSTRPAPLVPTQLTRRAAPPPAGRARRARPGARRRRACPRRRRPPVPARCRGRRDRCRRAGSPTA